MITRGLHDSGLVLLGTEDDVLIEAADDNPAIVACNDDLLEATGGAWDKRRNQNSHSLALALALALWERYYANALDTVPADDQRTRRRQYLGELDVHCVG